MKQSTRLGEIRTMESGEGLEIVAYRNCEDIDFIPKKEF